MPCNVRLGAFLALVQVSITHLWMGVELIQRFIHSTLEAGLHIKKGNLHPSADSPQLPLPLPAGASLAVAERNELP